MKHHSGERWDWIEGIVGAVESRIQGAIEHRKIVRAEMRELVVLVRFMESVFRIDDTSL
jgi:hypothetical protein